MDEALKSECIGVLEGLKEVVANNAGAMGQISALVEKLKVVQVAKPVDVKWEKKEEPKKVAVEVFHVPKRRGRKPGVKKHK